LPARLKSLRKLAADAGRPEPSLTVNMMAGQMAGVPWYWENPAAMDALLEKAALYQGLGADRLVVGIPTDGLDNAARGLDALATLADRLA
jgi:hypothetical protein